MSDFLPYTEPYVPTFVRRVEFTILSILEDELDPETGLPTGTQVVIETISGQAVVADQHGVERWVHTAISPAELLDKSVFSVEELQGIQVWLQNVRDTIEGLLLPEEE